MFLSLKSSQKTDIKPSTVSFWLKQTIIICCQQADQQSLYMAQVKANNIRAFAASKAFYGGISVNQIMPVCHWRAQFLHNFSLKDLTWTENGNLMNLGPVVVTQQIVQPSSSGKPKPREKDCKKGATSSLRH